MKFKQFLSSLPIEVYALAIFPFLITILLICFFNFSFSRFGFNAFLFYSLIGGRHFALAISILFLYFVAKITSPILDVLIFNKKDFVTLIKVFKNQLYFSFIIFFSSLLIALLIVNISIFSSHRTIIAVSSSLMDFDYFIFGGAPLFFITNFVNKTGKFFLSNVLVISYSILSIIFPILLLILFIKNKILARKFIMFFFLAQFISFPLWFLMPALIPYTMYIENPLKINVPENISKNIKTFNPDTASKAFLENISQNHKKTNNYLDLTTMPSMHACWGLGIVYFAFQVCLGLGFISLIWFFLEITGAMYLGEHYSLDIFLGLLVFLGSMFLVNLLFGVEKKYYKGKGSFFLIDDIQNDITIFFNYLQNKFNLIKKWFLRLKK